MRLRNIPGAKEQIIESEYAISIEEHVDRNRGSWHKVFGNANPIHIEVGMGKGRFLMDMARKNPDINYIGIEKYSSVLIRALEKRDELEQDNLIFVRMDATYIDDAFEKGEVAKIYLNFSDPWPKDRHAKRRLTSRTFLNRYDQFLADDGTIEFKTDNRGLFEFSLEEVTASGWVLEASTFDLHNDSKLNQGNIMTEYEEKFSAAGEPIHKLICSRKK